MTPKSKDFDLGLIPDPEVARTLGVTLMTIYRWDHDPSMGFPKPIRLKTRKYRSAKELTEWRDGLVREAAAHRKAGKKASPKAAA
jgi:predicted DNA-binding transcriptional regulator AlpA